MKFLATLYGPMILMQIINPLAGFLFQLTWSVSWLVFMLLNKEFRNWIRS